MAGYQPKDLKKKFVKVFVPEEGVDVTPPNEEVEEEEKDQK